MLLTLTMLMRYVVLGVMALGLIGVLLGLGDVNFLVPGAILLGTGTIALVITVRERDSSVG